MAAEGDSPDVLVVGNLNIDLLLGSIDEIPAWGTETMAAQMDLRTGGAAANSALVLQRLGVQVALCGSVGKDAFAEHIFRDLQSAGVETCWVARLPDPTGVSVSLNHTDGERLFVTYEGCLGHVDSEQVQTILQQASAARAFFLNGYFVLSSLPCEVLLDLFNLARSLGMITLLDTGWPPQGWNNRTREEVYQLVAAVDYFLPNEVEACELAGCSTVDKAVQALQRVVQQGIVVKRGGKGSLYAGRDGRTISVPAHPVNVVDTVGAGDAFDAGFLFGLLQNWPVKRSLGFANGVGALYVSRQWHSPVSLSDILSFAFGE